MKVIRFWSIMLRSLMGSLANVFNLFHSDGAKSLPHRSLAPTPPYTAAARRTPSIPDTAARQLIVTYVVVNRYFRELRGDEMETMILLAVNRYLK